MDSPGDGRQRKASLFADLPPLWPTDLAAALRAQVHASGITVIVLDDDPTGTQTVHGVPVLTSWSVEALRTELLNDAPALYLLTNSRSMSLAAAQKLNVEIGRTIVSAAQQTGRRVVVASRSDSTLRGHFPGEVQALADGLEQDFAAWLLVPFFAAGGRYTINNMHYVADGDWLIPAGETTFAGDATFGYRASDMRHWVAEKTDGHVPADTVATISIEDIRRGGPDRVAALLLDLPHGSVCVANAADERDLQVFVQGVLIAEDQGRRFLYRTAASFVAVRAGIEPRPLLTRDELDLPTTGGGLIVVGSYVPTTSKQIDALVQASDVTALEVDVDALLDDERYQPTIARIAREANNALAANRDVAIVTSRQLVTAGNGEHSLELGQRISAGLVEIVRALSERPRYVLAKGGITSSDIATRGLGVQRALVLGQILPGVPVWQLGPESRYPGSAYIVFPGNVGNATALVEIVTMLKE